MDKEKNEKPAAYGHRERLRKRYFDCGIEAFSEHEKIEFLLFYAIPRKDTKPIAYKLLEEYGTVEGVLSASVESLMESGLTENAAMLFNFTHDLQAVITKKKLYGRRVEAFEQVGNYLQRELEKDPTERMLALLLDSKNCVISLETVCTGGFTAANINMRKLTQLALSKNAAKVVVAHNHPSGLLKASLQDYVATKNIEYILSQMDIELVEHYIITSDGFIGLKNEKAKESAAQQTLGLSGGDYGDEI